MPNAKLLVVEAFRIELAFYTEGSVIEVFMEEATELLKKYPNNLIPFDEAGELANDYATGKKVMPSDFNDEAGMGFSGGLTTEKL